MVLGSARVSRAGSASRGKRLCQFVAVEGKVRDGETRRQHARRVRYTNHIYAHEFPVQA